MPSIDMIPHHLMDESLQDYLSKMEQDPNQIHRLDYELNTGGNPIFLKSVAKL